MDLDQRAAAKAAAHAQHGARLRLDWGPTGGGSIAAAADIAVVVDVLSFTTTLSIAAARGMRVYPFGWKDERAASFAAERNASLAVGRFEARSLDRPTASLSPAELLRSEPVPRLVLPSPNGSTICAALEADVPDLQIVGASLRNRTAVASWLRPRIADGASVAFVPAGERWPDGSLRPAVEDLWGAGAVLDLLRDTIQRDETSPEAEHAAAAYRAVVEGGPDCLRDALRQCASGQELIAVGFGDDVEAAAELDGDDVVPLLTADGFVAAGPA
ncbi:MULTISPECIES: 2-phosphosulfolactate phosphatase [Nocardioides]|uniref:Probable 2-phosphosulfolactate phosphatase n=1 Tax=Nocardioides vastitatis TaxID=2568655 RepID=A0ABW0ZR41_9ACTN|nr:2-phosphosulfolactate phosphatase [Nocardioides sp.]